MSELHSQSLKTNTLFFLLFFFCAISGSFIEGLSPESVSKVRALFILSALVALCLLALFIPRFSTNCSKFTWLVLSVSSIAFFVALFRNGFVEALSPFLRIVCFVLTAEIVSHLRLRNPKFDHKFFRLCIILLVVALVVILYEALTDKTQFLNGAFRHDSNFSSPIGFSAYVFIIFIAMAFFWLKYGSLWAFLFSLVALTFILMSGTRSVSVASFLFFILAIVMRGGAPSKIFLFFPAFFLVCLGLYFFGFFDSILERVASVSGGELDNSSSFRLYILNVYFSNVSDAELIFGLGLGGFYTWFFDLTGIPGVAPHFEFLWFFSEFGLLGAGVYFSAIFAFLIFGINRLLRPEDRPYLFLLFSLVFGYFVALQFANPFYFLQFCLVFGALLGIFLSNDRVRIRISSRSCFTLFRTTG